MTRVHNVALRTASVPRVRFACYVTTIAGIFGGMRIPNLSLLYRLIVRVAGAILLLGTPAFLRATFPTPPTHLTFLATARRPILTSHYTPIPRAHCPFASRDLPRSQHHALAYISVTLSTPSPPTGDAAATL